jgi:membrane protein implicated in regulation of membrane protease activity
VTITDILLTLIAVSLVLILLSLLLFIRIVKDALRRFGTFTFSVSTNDRTALDIGRRVKVVDNGELARRAAEEARLPKRGTSPTDPDRDEVLRWE